MATESLCFSTERFEDAITVLVFIPVLAGVDVVQAMLEGAVDHQGEVTGRGSNGFGHAQQGFHSSQVCPERRLGVMQSLSGHAQGRRSSVGAGTSSAAFTSPGQLAVVGTQRQPTGEMLLRGPAGHVQPDFADDFDCGIAVDAVNPRQIDPHLVPQQRLRIEWKTALVATSLPRAAASREAA